MADKKDELAARRKFDTRLAAFERERPGLKTAEKQTRLTQHTEEQTPCQESPQATQEADRQGAGI